MPLPKEDHYTLADVLTWNEQERIELIDGAPALVYSDGKKPLSIAVEELDKGKIKILAEDESGEDEE